MKFNDYSVNDNHELPPRERILRAAFETILEDQISGTRLRKIATKSGITQGHLHYYFATKDDLLLELRDRLIRSFSEERQAVLADDTKSSFSKLLALFNLKKGVIQGKAMDYVLFDFWVQSASDRDFQKDIDVFYRPWREMIAEVIRQGIDKGEFNSRFADILPSYLISLMDGAALQYLIDDSAFDLDAYFEQAGRLIAELLKPESQA